MLFYAVIGGNTKDFLHSAKKSGEEAAKFFSLPFRKKIWQGAAGELSGSGVGSSIDFQDHRNYMPGDDPRHINWNAFARTGNYSMKLYREEVRPGVELVCDISSSMFISAAKTRMLFELLFFSLASAANFDSRVKLFFVDDNFCRFVNGVDFDLGFCEEILAYKRKLPKDKPHENILDLSLVHFLPGTLRVFISDLLFATGTESILHKLCSQKGHVILFAPYDSQEAEPEWLGNYEFIDVEERSRYQHRIDKLLLKKYQQAYRLHFELWELDAKKNHAVFIHLNTKEKLLAAFSNNTLLNEIVDFYQ